MTTGLEKLKAKFDKVKGTMKPGQVKVVVGYTQGYALAVHENLTASHAEGKQAKYLEGPARAAQNDIRKIIHESVFQGDGLEAGCLRAGMFLQRKSQEVVPIDTGALRASAFTALAEEEDAVAGVAYGQSEAIRIAELNRRTQKKQRQREKAQGKARKGRSR